MRLFVAEDWVEAPLREFVDDARVRLAVLLSRSGQVLGQFGFATSVDVMSVCALAAASSAASAELGRQLDGRPFRELHYAGRSRQLFLAQVQAGAEPLILLTVFDDESSLGLVRLFFQEFCTAMASVVLPAPRAAPGEAASTLVDDFENDLRRNLAVMFGRA